MLHKDLAHGRLARLRLRLAEFDGEVETRAGAAHHGPNIMSRFETPAADTSPIPEEFPCLALPNFSRAWVAHDSKAGRDYPPTMLSKLLQAQATDIRCLEVRKEMDGNEISRYREPEQALLVRVDPRDRAVHVYVPKQLRSEVLTLKYEPANAGHPGTTKMYPSMWRSYYWENMVADIHGYVGGCVACAKGKVRGRRRTAPLNVSSPKEPFVDLCPELLGPFLLSAKGKRYLLVIVDRFTNVTRVVPIPRQNAQTVAFAF